MSKYEPRIDHFFGTLSAENVTSELCRKPENVEEMLYYTDEEQVSAVVKAFSEIKDAGQRQQVLNGFAEIMPFSVPIVERLLCEQVKNIGILPAFERIFSLQMIIGNQIKRLNNVVTKDHALEDYKKMSDDNQKRIQELNGQLEEERELLKSFDAQREEIRVLEQRIEELQAQQKAEFWEQKKQELSEIQIRLENAQKEYIQECKELKNLQKKLDSYDNSTSNKEVSEYLATLRKLAAKLPDDEVN